MMETPSPLAAGRTTISYHLTLEEHAAYLHAKATGERTPQNVARFFDEVGQACEQRGRAAVLLEMGFSGPSLDPASIFKVVSQRIGEASRLKKIAYYEASVDVPSRPQFAETVAVNRGLNVRLFNDLEAAIRWVSA